MVFDAHDLKALGIGKDSDHSITSVKISPDGSVFACASSNFKIYIHENSVDSNSVVAALDFCIDSMFIRGISSSYECLSCKFSALV
jgi:WD40 repeat protein